MQRSQVLQDCLFRPFCPAHLVIKRYFLPDTLVLEYAMRDRSNHRLASLGGIRPPAHFQAVA